LSVILFYLQLEALDLSNNKFYGLDSVKELVEKSPNIIRLNLGKNKVEYVIIVCFKKKMSIHSH